jgi:hypothetical protein
MRRARIALMLDTVEQVGLELGHLYIAERLFKSFSAKN